MQSGAYAGSGDKMGYEKKARGHFWNALTMENPVPRQRAMRAPNTQVTAITLARKVSRAEPIRTKKHRPHIPAPKILRIEQRLLAGESGRQIARAEHCSRSTVAKVVRAPELEEHLQRIRERIWGMADCAADVVYEAIVQNRDAKISYELLRDIGVLPRASQIVHRPNQLATTSEEDLRTRVVRGMASVMLERHEVFGLELPAELQAVIKRENALEEKVRSGPH